MKIDKELPRLLPFWVTVYTSIQVGLYTSTFTQKYFD